MADRSSTGGSSAGGSSGGRSAGGRSSGGRTSAGRSSAGGSAGGRSEAGRSSGGRSSGGRSAGSGSRRKAARESGSGIGAEFDGAGEAAAGYGWGGDDAGLLGGWPSPVVGETGDSAGGGRGAGGGGSAGGGQWAGSGEPAGGRWYGSEWVGNGEWVGGGDASGGSARGRRVSGGGYRSGAEDEAKEQDDPESVARLICLRLLTAAPRTRAQLADALRQRGVPADAAETVLSRFAEVGLIDDATFAAAWVESRHYGRGLGRRALAAELSRRGVDRGDIEAAVEQLSAETERATALALVERRLAHTTGPSEAARIKKLVGMLARKGYSAGLAYSVVKEAIERAGQDASGLGDDDAFGYEFGEEEEFDGSS